MGQGTLDEIKPKFNPNKPFTPVNGKPTFDPSKPFEPVKKKDSESDLPISSNVPQNGTQPTIPSQSQSTSVSPKNKLPEQPEGDLISSATKAVANTISSLPKQEKVHPLQKVSDLAKKQQADYLNFLHTTQPLRPEGEHNDLISKGIDNNIEKRVQSGDPDAISEVVGKELAAIKRNKQGLEEEKNKKTRSLDAGNLGFYKEGVELDEKIKQENSAAAKIVKDGVQALNLVAANTFLESPDKSDAVQNKMGADLRRQYAKIGADVTLSDQQGIAARVPDLEETVNSPLFQHLPIKEVMKAQLDVAKKTKEQLEYENRATILNASYGQLTDDMNELLADPNVGKDDPRRERIVEMGTNIEAQRDNLLNQYPQVKRQQQQELVSELWAEYIRSAEKGEKGFAEKMLQGRDLFSGRKLNTPEEIKAVSELSQKTSLPMTEEEVKSVADQARVPSFAGSFLRGFGSSFTDTQQGIHRLFDSKVDADISNKLLEETKYHAPAAFQKNNNLPNILGNMFGGAGNMTGLAVQMWVAGELFGGVTGLTKLADVSTKGIQALSEAEVGTLGAASQVVPGKTMAKWLVDLGAADSEGEALGMMLKTATKAKHIGGTVAAIGIPTYEAAYQQASQYTDDEGKRNTYASESAIANILGMMALNPQAIVGKGLSGISKEQVMANFLKSEFGYGSKDIIKARLAEFAKPIIGVVPAVGIPLAQEAISKENLFGIHTSGAEMWNQFLDRSGHMVLSVIPFGALGAARIPTSPMAKASIYEVGLKPEKSISNVEESYTKGDITEAEKNRQISLINKTSNLVNTVPDRNNVGKILSQPEKNELVYQQLQHAALLDKQSKATEAMKPAYDQELADTQAKVDKIMGLKSEERPEQKPEPTVTEKRKLSEASSKWKQNIKAIDERTDINAAEKEKLKQAEDERHVNELQALQSPPLTPDQELLTELQNKAGGESKKEDLQYFVDKAAEDPAAFMEIHGKKLTNQLLEQVPIEKLKGNRDYLLDNFGESESTDYLNDIIKNREKPKEEAPTAASQNIISEKLPPIKNESDVYHEYNNKDLSVKKGEEFKGREEFKRAVDEVADNTGEKIVRVVMPIEKLSTTENIYGLSGEKDLSKYQDEIKRGIQTPIVVEHNNGEYNIMDGHHRLEAYKKLGYKEVPIVVNESGTKPNIDFIAEREIGGVNFGVAKEKNGKFGLYKDGEKQTEYETMDEAKKAVSQPTGKEVQAEVPTVSSGEGQADGKPFTEKEASNFHLTNKEAVNKMTAKARELGLIGENDYLGGVVRGVEQDGNTKADFTGGNLLFNKDGSITALGAGEAIIFDRNGDVISHDVKTKGQKEVIDLNNKLEGSKESIKTFEKTRDSEDFKYTTETTSDGLGNKRTSKRLKTAAELKESTDKINAAIEKAKLKIEDLSKKIESHPDKSILEQSSPEKTKFINDNFDGVVAQLKLKGKLKVICP